MFQCVCGESANVCVFMLVATSHRKTPWNGGDLILPYWVSFQYTALRNTKTHRENKKHLSYM